MSTSDGARRMRQSNGTRISATAGSTSQFSADRPDEFSSAPEENEAIATVPETLHAGHRQPQGCRCKRR
jgi:hypothetical protein